MPAGPVLRLSGLLLLGQLGLCLSYRSSQRFDFLLRLFVARLQVGILILDIIILGL